MCYHFVVIIWLFNVISTHIYTLVIIISLFRSTSFKFSILSFLNVLMLCVSEYFSWRTIVPKSCALFYCTIFKGHFKRQNGAPKSHSLLCALLCAQIVTVSKSGALSPIPSMYVSRFWFKVHGLAHYLRFKGHFKGHDCAPKSCPLLCTSNNKVYCQCKALVRRIMEVRPRPPLKYFLVYMVHHLCFG